MSINWTIVPSCAKKEDWSRWWVQDANPLPTASELPQIALINYMISEFTLIVYPLSIFLTVDFPAPVGPIILTNSSENVKTNEK